MTERHDEQPHELVTVEDVYPRMLTKDEERQYTATGRVMCPGGCGNYMRALVETPKGPLLKPELYCEPCHISLTFFDPGPRAPKNVLSGEA